MLDTPPPSLDDDLKHDLVARGYDRRSFARIAALLGGGIAATQAMPAFAQVPSAAVGAVRIGANECWTGPFAAGVQAAMQAIAQGNRYEPDGEIRKLREAVAMVERVPAERVIAWPGSSDPLARTAVTFASPTRGIVTADPTFEPIWQVGQWLGAKVSKVPLAPNNAHDVRAMLAADPDAGLYYICTPNNPTGTLTPLADIEWLLAAKPKDAVVLVDEAYLHFAGAPSAMRLAAARSDVIVMRSFSKLFGMAGMRLGLTVADPALHKRMMRYDGDLVTMMLPIPAVACGTASLTQTAEIAARRAQMEAAREETLAHVAKRGLKVLPGSRANMFLLEWKDRTPRQMSEALLAQGVQIGRAWSAHPQMSRITVGSAEDMAKFRLALDRILTA